VTIKGDPNNPLLFAKRIFLSTNLNFTVNVRYLISKQKIE